MSDALRILSGRFGRVALLDVNRSLIRHAHPHRQILIKVEGDDAELTVGENHIPLTDQSMVTINVWQPHAYVHASGHNGTLILALHLEGSWLHNHWTNISPDHPLGAFLHSNVKSSPEILRAVMMLARGMLDGTVKHDGLVSELTNALVEQLDRSQSISPSFRRPPLSLDRRLEAAISMLTANPSSPLDVDALASVAKISRAHLFRLFHSTLGVTPHLYLNAIRIERAIAVITGSEEPLHRVAYSLGFSEQTHFTRFFKDHCSVSPSKFRAAARSSKTVADATG